VNGVNIRVAKAYRATELRIEYNGQVRSRQLPSL
jgi:hypothetical protein